MSTDENKRGSGFTVKKEEHLEKVASDERNQQQQQQQQQQPSVTAGKKKKVIVKSADMKESMQKEAIDCAIVAYEKHSVEKDVAEYIKKEFDKNHGPTWHCIVGRNFGSYVTHETNHFVYFYLDQKAILLFKSG
ncbi:Dynein light chain 1 cytoplasmic-like protein [Zostera marina]|uniref:Dynein light chain n=1 Tax=Zostera marina TaxID=29655 RepID=A0A0K9PB70_ZOSMR|nr:Dynein light chain 1 cytoplasmic-like protein [Zostera marina]